jgi:ketosteroid isomerase-like protein
MPIVDAAAAAELAHQWIAAWNSHDLERVYALYDDDFEMRSPLIIERGFSPTGALRGKDAIRPYWGAGIATAVPPLKFELIEVFAGVDQVAITYRSVGRKIVTEVLELDAARRIIRGSACHGPAA